MFPNPIDIREDVGDDTDVDELVIEEQDVAWLPAHACES